MPAWDVAVVGLGAMGSAALFHLASRGKRVIGIEQFEPGHARGSSHGESRLIRLAYFEHPSYVPLVRLAYRNWRALEDLTGAQVLVTSGILEAGRPGSAIVRGSLQACLDHDLPHQPLTPAEASRRFPAVRLPPDWEAVFQPDAGILLPELAIRLHVEAARARGAEVRCGSRVLEAAPAAGGVRLRLQDGTPIEAGAVVLAAGPWMGALTPRLAPRLQLTRQALVWLEPAEPELVRLDRLPLFMFDGDDDVIYGVPDFAGTGVKAASHNSCGPIDDPDAPRPDVSQAEVLQVERALRRHLPAAVGRLARTMTCTYTRIARPDDDDFVIGLDPDCPQIVLASPCSGHGFKFASIIGEILADLATTGATDKPIGRFSPARFDAL
jgi:sarcosine oxidase